MNSQKIAAALRVLALAFEASEEETTAAPAPAAEPQKRGRGRPAKGEETAAPAPSAPVPASSTPSPTPAPAEVDPFAAPAPAAPVATLDQVRKALTDLKVASSQEIAVAVLKSAGEAANVTDLKPEKYGAVVVAAAAKQAEYTPKAVTPEVDPFAAPTSTAAPAVSTVTLDDVRAEVVASSKRTSQDTVAKVVMDLGGKAPITGGGFGPSWKALPVEKYAETIAALKALPTTK